MRRWERPSRVLPQLLVRSFATACLFAGHKTSTTKIPKDRCARPSPARCNQHESVLVVRMSVVPGVIVAVVASRLRTQCLRLGCPLFLELLLSSPADCGHNRCVGRLFPTPVGGPGACVACAASMRPTQQHRGDRVPHTTLRHSVLAQIGIAGSGCGVQQFRDQAAVSTGVNGRWCQQLGCG